MLMTQDLGVKACDELITACRELQDLRRDLAAARREIEAGNSILEKAGVDLRQLYSDLTAARREKAEIRERTIEECIRAIGDRRLFPVSIVQLENDVDILRALSAQPDPHKEPGSGK